MNYLDKLKEAKRNRRHSTCDSLYGHMSKVSDIEDFEKYPNLKNANPQVFILNEGEGLIIPKNWWHHVISYENMYGCNFWTSKTLSDKPLKIKHNIKINYDDLKDEDVYIWKSGISSYKDENIEKIKFKDYMDSKNDHEYFWTLKNYGLLARNSHLINKIRDKIEIPDIIKNTKTNFDFNIMACSKKNITTLHYDDDDGLLCVTSGMKKIIMFPPEDTIHLYPIKIERYPWKNSPAINFCYNLYRKTDDIISGNSSSNLLYQTCKNNTGVLSSISKIIKHFHGNIIENSKNKTVWAFKKNNDNQEYNWELYTLYKCEDGKFYITSYEIYPERTIDGSYISNFSDEYIFKNDNCNNESEYFEGIIYRNGETKTERGYWILDSQQNFYKNYYSYIEKLNYPKDLFTNEIVKKYNCKYSCIHQKNNQEFYIQYIGISKKDFLDFLIENNYDSDLINHYQNSEYEISNEITIVYNVETKQVKRSAFYGIV